LAHLAGEHLENHLQSAERELLDTDWAPAALQPVHEPLLPGLSQLRRKVVLAASDPLMADLMLSLDLLDDAVVVLHEDGRLIHCNHAAGALATPLNLSAVHSLHVLGPGEPWDAIRQILREYRANPCCLERETHDAGTGKCWAIRLGALAYLGVMPRRLVLVIRDISEAIRTRELLRERDVMATAGTLLAGAAHQAKNAIFGLSATLDAFEARFQNGPAEDEYFDNLRAGVARVQALMRDLLDYATPTAHEVQPVSMSAIVRSSASDCHALAEKLGVKLVLDVFQDADAVVHPARIVRALENLLENAIQHSRPEGTVTVRLARTKLGDREVLRCDVTDQGPGFPPEHIERLFTPFFTLRPGGTGLGLTIAKRIVEDLGGRIRLSNLTAGGAEVSVWLPMRDDNTATFRNSLSEHESGTK
jgi:signal transduction histidine kinase